MRAAAHSAGRVLWYWFPFVAALWLLGGCWVTTQQGERMQEAGEVRDREIAQLRAELRADREQFDNKVAKLEEVLEKATRLLTRNSADRGAQVDKMGERMALVEGQLAELRYSLETLSHATAVHQAEFEKRLEQLARKTGTDIAVESSEIPADRKAHYVAGQQAFRAGDHPKSRALFREFLTRYPHDDWADDAQYWIGASYLQEGKPATALGEFRKVLSLYGKGDALDRVLFGMADAFFQLHACTDAKNALDALIRRKPSNDLKRRARQKLREVVKAPANYCTS